MKPLYLKCIKGVPVKGGTADFQYVAATQKCRMFWLHRIKHIMKIMIPRSIEFGRVILILRSFLETL